MAELQINSYVIAGVPKLQLEGELDCYSAPRVRQVLDAVMDGARPVVVIDMARLEYIDSSGLGALVAALRQAQAEDGTILLVAPSGVVARVLKVTGLDKVFSVCDDEAEALRRLPADSRKVPA
jgi:anti-sigma B factor antagonist